MEVKTKKIYVVIFTPTFKMLKEGYKPVVLDWFDNAPDACKCLARFQQNDTLFCSWYTIYSPTILVDDININLNVEDGKEL